MKPVGKIRFQGDLYEVLVSPLSVTKNQRAIEDEFRVLVNLPDTIRSFGPHKAKTATNTTQSGTLNRIRAAAF